MLIENIYAIIVTYNPQLAKLKELVISLKQQNVNPLIIDNGTLEENDLESLRDIAYVISLGNNEGIAKAQNIGIRFAKENAADGVIFFDQDSEISDNFVESLISDYISVSKYDNNIGMIGPTFIDSRYKFYYKQILLNRFGVRKKIDPAKLSTPFKVSIIISSGSFVLMSTLDSVGYMDERFFIDYVDTEWCFRMLSKGYSIYVSTSAIMEHAIGDKMINFGGLHIPVHSPIRRYYRMRNAIIFLNYKHIPLLLKLRDNAMNLIHQTLIIINEKDKRENLKIAYKSIIDGLKGKTGKL
ncbi:TPA: rhamnosyltransferase [Raoultella ornithinolytica]